MGKASDNIFPKVIITEGSAPANPSSGSQKLFIDSADHKLKRVNSSGTVTIIEGGSGSGAGADGWTGAGGTWAYASPTTITVPSGAASIYAIGDKLKWTANSVVLYAYVVGIADTLLTVAGNAVTNFTITNNYYSHEVTPIGFPSTFAHAASLTGWSGTPTQDIAYLLNGRNCTLIFTISGASNSASTSFNLPIAAAAPYPEGVLGLAQNNSAYLTTACRMYVTATDVTFSTDMASAGWATSGTKSVRGCISYKI